MVVLWFQNFWLLKSYHQHGKLNFYKNLLLKSPITFADWRKNPNSESKIENHGKEEKYPFKAHSHYPECSDKPRLTLAQHTNFWGPCVTIAAGIVAENARQHRGSQWSLLRIHTNILPASKDYHSKWEQCANSPVCNHLRPVVVPRKSISHTVCSPMQQINYAKHLIQCGSHYSSSAHVTCLAFTGWQLVRECHMTDA